MDRQLIVHEQQSPDWETQSVPRRPLRIALVNMPMARCDFPSIQCGLLKEVLVRYGHHVDVHYLNLELAGELGSKVYEALLKLASERETLLGEWLFTAAAFGLTASPPGAPGYLDAYSELTEKLADIGLTAAALLRVQRETLPQWINSQADGIPWDRYDLVGFTSTFAQNVAAIAMAQAIKERFPDVVTVFGGANFDGDMGQEYVRCFTAIDYAIIGEGEIILPVLAARLSAGRSAAGLPGVCARGADGKASVSGYAPNVANLDEVPTPDYSEYFQALDRMGRTRVLGQEKIRLSIETARGCWWGQKHHCTFCGMNGLAMNYRAKSPERAFDEITELTGRYRVLSVQAVDNILDMRYLTTVCERLAETHWDVQLMYEVKANLSRQQLRVLRRAGFTRIQPGVESLSTHILSLINKGATMLTQVRMLKWSQYYGIRPYWNILYGFPGERERDYNEQIELIPSLLHLRPPVGVGPMWLERFAAYFSGGHPIHDVVPMRAYRYAYPIEGIDLERAAYFFDCRKEDVCPDAVHQLLQAAIDEWRRRWSNGARPVLTYQRGRGWITILDTRAETPRQLSLSGWRMDAYVSCDDKPHGAAVVRQAIDKENSLTNAQVAEFLDRCVAERLMVCEDGKYLSLALPRNDNW